MGGGMEADLTHGAVAAMSTADGLRPVLQVVGAPAARGHGVVRRYRVLLSDGVHSQQAFLQPSLNGLVTTGRLRDGSVIRVLDYVSRSVYCQRSRTTDRAPPPSPACVGSWWICGLIWLMRAELLGEMLGFCKSVFFCVGDCASSRSVALLFWLVHACRPRACRRSLTLHASNNVYIFVRIIKLIFFVKSI
jgi:hypothetical protein